VLQGYLDAVNVKTSAITVKHLSSQTIKEIPLPLPPPEEQQRIAEAIDSYLTRFDDAVASLGRVQAKLKVYRASVLKAAVGGLLVPTEATLARSEKRAYEPAQALLARILKSRRRRWEETELAKLKAKGMAPKDDTWKAKYEEPAAPDTSTLPDLPDGWCWATLPQLGELNRGKSRHRPRNDPRLLGGKYPFVQTGDIRKAETWLRTFEDTYSDFGLAQSRLWPAGTLCITIAANIAETAILGFDACFPDSVVGFLQSELVLTRYVEMFLRTARQRLDQYAPATAQKNINLDTLSKVAVPLPPLNEQRRMVEELDRLISVGTAIGDYVSADQHRCGRLRQSVLKWAFEGKLVDQDPTDEPAERLLARIRAGRAAVSPAKKIPARRARGAA
jgi:type I restriction enzyme S subunit